jgi:uncharacterized membrane protein YjjP (DUF1212 family)
MKLKLLLKLLSAIGFILTILPSFFVFNNIIDLNTDKLLMFIGTIIWFSSSPFWMNKGVK